MAEAELLPNTETPPEVAIAGSLIPYPRDDERARYLGYMSCGFTVREALHMIDRSKTWLSLARRHPDFVALENRIPEFRKELSKEYVEIEFFRNFRMALEKDFRVWKKSLNPGKDEDGNELPMSRQDHEYLLKMRSQYTPQQLQILEAIVTDSGEGWNFAKWVAEHPDIIQVSRTDTVTVKV